MILTWMLLGLLVGAILAAAAWLLERGLHGASLPTRGVWLAAMVGTLVLTAVAPLRRDPPVVVVVVQSPGSASLVKRPGPSLLSRVRQAAGMPMQMLAGVGGTVPDRLLGGAWLIVTVLLTTLASATLRRARRARNAWPILPVAGVPVRVSPEVGPAVLGLRRPEIVIPAWLLEADAEEQRLVVLHESEHLRARDPALMAAAAAIALLLPWNPAVWWMLRRLRLAVEMDCDRRILRGGVRPARYGALLLRVAGRAPALTLVGPAMAGAGAHLERRLKAMINPIPRFGALRTAGLCMLSAGVVLAACETRLPTTAEIEELDARSAERQARPMLDGEASFIIDGRPASAAEAHALTPDEIAEIEVRKLGSETGQIRITTVAAAGGTRRQAPPGAMRINVEGPAGESRERTELSRFEGLILIDGVVATPPQAAALDQHRVVSIDVVKGSAAAQYDDPRARNGVIRITTRQ
jgi:hypothetical protein